MYNAKLLEILRLGILEIRLLSTKSNQDIERINKLSNILHNIPNALGDKKVDFDFDLLKRELGKYQDTYKSGINFKEVLDWVS